MQRTLLDTKRKADAPRVFSLSAVPLELTLLETKRKANAKRVFGLGTMSLAVHTAVIGAVVFGTLHAGRSDNQVKADTTLVLLEPEQRQKPPDQAPVPVTEPLKGFQTVVVPPVIPTTLPTVDLQEHFDPKDYSGAGVEGGRATGVDPSVDQVYADAVVDEPPAVLSGPPRLYPDLMRRAGIQGRVVVRAIVDTTGRAEPSSVRIVQSPSPGFDETTRKWVLAALFRPARLRGRAVRAYVNLPFDYAVTETKRSDESGR
ncbi:MAG TPA: TonB family protein [Gemmatimonadales bacterium]|jgi:TonB family protein|nr:TonB family protein [Gemmatimonadales bacterium]